MYRVTATILADRLYRPAFYFLPRGSFTANDKDCTFPAAVGSLIMNANMGLVSCFAVDSVSPSLLLWNTASFLVIYVVYYVIY
jgi:hypothetical protein